MIVQTSQQVNCGVYDHRKAPSESHVASSLFNFALTKYVCGKLECWVKSWRPDAFSVKRDVCGFEQLYCLTNLDQTLNRKYWNDVMAGHIYNESIELEIILAWFAWCGSDWLACWRCKKPARSLLLTMWSKCNWISFFMKWLLCCVIHQNTRLANNCADLSNHSQK